jgi:hypothetical protein
VKSTQKRAILQAITVFSALLSGLAVAWIAFGMSGAGDGWNSAFISASAVVTAPAAAVAWFIRRTRAGWLFSAALVALNMTIVFVLIRESNAEGSHYVSRVVNAIPGYFAVWLSLWAAWQLLALAAAVGSVRYRREAGVSPN